MESSSEELFQKVKHEHIGEVKIGVEHDNDSLNEELDAKQHEEALCDYNFVKSECNLLHFSDDDNEIDPLLILPEETENEFNDIDNHEILNDETLELNDNCQQIDDE